MKYLFKFQFVVIQISCIILLLISACSKSDKNAVEAKNEFLIPLQETIEKYHDGTTEKINVEYTYETDGDFFWKKTEYKSDGKLIKTIERIFDENKLPQKETITENGKITSISKMKYDKNFYEMTERQVYASEETDAKLLSKELWKFDADGYLENYEVTKFSIDANYKNSEGTKITQYAKMRPFPGKQNLPRGAQLYSYFIESGKLFYNNEKLPPRLKGADQKFKIGDLINSEETAFNTDGVPTSHKASNPSIEEHPTLEYYSFEKDGLSNIITLTGYSNEQKDQITDKNIETNYEYDENNFINQISMNRYNKESEVYDTPVSSKVIEWMDPQIESKHNWMEPSLKYELLIGKRQTIYQTTIEKYSDGEKIVVESEADFQIDNPPVDPPFKPIRKSILKYKVIKLK